MIKNRLKIIPYNEDFRENFKALNVEWLTDMFVVEPYDLAVLSDPEKYILSGGGNIWFAQTPNDEIVGTCALMEHESGHYELTKMAVSKSARGLGAGRMILKFLIDKALGLNAKSLFLLTNTDCKAAIHLYKEEGFIKDEEIRIKYGASYERCNLGMLYKRNDSLSI